MLSALLLLVLYIPSSWATIEITDSFGKHRFEQAPQRVVVVNWTLAEQLFELGVVPLGIADIEGYRKQVGFSEVPDNITDVGARSAPDLNAIEALKPDLIIIGYSQRDLIRPLSRISRVVYFNNFSRRYNNADKARERFLTLATLFDREAQAQQKLQQLDTRFLAMRQQLSDHFSGELPIITVLQHDQNRCCWLYSENSLLFYTLQRLGFKTGWPQAPSKLGVSRQKLSDLSKLPGWVLIMQEASSLDLSSDPQWASLPFIKQQRYRTLAPIWSYGGVMSMLYQAEKLLPILQTMPEK